MAWFCRRGGNFSLSHHVPEWTFPSFLSIGNKVLNIILSIIFTALPNVIPQASPEHFVVTKLKDFKPV
jgi:hypothetical protein